jgi:hypothetical protein
MKRLIVVAVLSSSRAAERSGVEAERGAVPGTQSEQSRDFRIVSRCHF